MGEVLRGTILPSSQLRPGIRLFLMTLPCHFWDADELCSFKVTAWLVVPSGMPSFLLYFNLFHI